MNMQEKINIITGEDLDLRKIHELIEDLSCDKCNISCSLVMKPINDDSISCSLIIDCKCGELGKMVDERVTDALSEQ